MFYVITTKSLSELNKSFLNKHFQCFRYTDNLSSILEYLKSTFTNIAGLLVIKPSVSPSHSSEDLSLSLTKSDYPIGIEVIAGAIKCKVSMFLVVVARVFITLLSLTINHSFIHSNSAWNELTIFLLKVLVQKALFLMLSPIE